MKKLLHNRRKVISLGLVAYIWGTFVGCWIIDPNPVMIVTFGLAYMVLTVAILWPYRRRQMPQSVVSLHDWQGMTMARKQMARRRPWLWGPLKHLWVYSFHRLEFPMVAGPTYRWKTRADRRIEKSLHQCCGVPEGQQCASHEERS